MTTIYKYPLEIVDRQIVRMPTGAAIRAVMVQDGVTCLWAEVDPKAALEDRTFHIVGTGHAVPAVPYLRHVDSVIDGRFVWHVYEALSLIES